MMEIFHWKKWKKNKKRKKNRGKPDLSLDGWPQSGGGVVAEGADVTVAILTVRARCSEEERGGRKEERGGWGVGKRKKGCLV